MPDWRFVTLHALVLLCIARNQHTRLRDIAACTGITERATQNIVRDLEAEGYVSRHKIGNRNVYEVHADRPLRHPMTRHRDVGELLNLLLEHPEARDDAELTQDCPRTG
jgi:predicted transcriptional regulator